jgi:hypothetical protein
MRDLDKYLLGFDNTKLMNACLEKHNKDFNTR